MEEKNTFKKSIIRGKNSEDEKSFSNIECKSLLHAQEEVLWLLNRDYPLNSIMSLVGGRYQFIARQRLVIQRATSSQKKYLVRKKKLFKGYTSC